MQDKTHREYKKNQTADIYRIQDKSEPGTSHIGCVSQSRIDYETYHTGDVE